MGRISTASVTLADEVFLLLPFFVLINDVLEEGLANVFVKDQVVDIFSFKGLLQLLNSAAIAQKQLQALCEQKRI